MTTKDKFPAIGFTGTRNGLTQAQKHQLRDLVMQLKPVIVHHGGCVGADEEFHNLILQDTAAHIYVHPCNLPAKYKFKVQPSERVTILSEKPPLARNRDIMDPTHFQIACPFEAKEQPKGGTWSTIRYVRGWDYLETFYLIHPSGAVTS